MDTFSPGRDSGSVSAYAGLKGLPSFLPSSPPVFDPNILFALQSLQDGHNHLFYSPHIDDEDPLLTFRMIRQCLQDYFPAISKLSGMNTKQT